MAVIPKLQEIADRIHAHLVRFENDPEINKRINKRPGGNRIPPYFQAGAWVSGRYVSVRYVSFHPSHNLSKAGAIIYLEWLDAGNVGKHTSTWKKAAHAQ